MQIIIAPNLLELCVEFVLKINEHNFEFSWAMNTVVYNLFVNKGACFVQV